MIAHPNFNLKHLSIPFGIISSVLMFTLATFILYDKIHCTSHSNYFVQTNDLHIAWVVVLLIASAVQTVLILHNDCYKCRLLSDLMLQISGILILIVDWIFVSQHPPFNWLMIALPLWGFGMIIAGRHLGKRSRFHVKEQRKKRNG